MSHLDLISKTLIKKSFNLNVMLVLGTLLFPFASYTQSNFIIAGDTSNCIVNNYNVSISPVSNFYVDLNNNWDIDLQFYSGHSFGSSSTTEEAEVFCSNQNIFIAPSNNSPYLNNDSIKIDMAWSNTSQCLNGYTTWHVPPYNTTYCGQEVSGAYLGLKYVENNSTFLGWIKINVSGYSITIIQSAMQNTSVDVTNMFFENKKTVFYPNPSTGRIAFSKKDSNTKNLEIYNLLGESIYQSSISNQQSLIDISAQPKGIYYLKISDGKEIQTEKIVLR